MDSPACNGMARGQSRASHLPQPTDIRIGWAQRCRIGRCPTRTTVKIFDINAICVGGWIDLPEWSTQLVPWLLKQCEPKATGDWWLTHVVEIRR